MFFHHISIIYRPCNILNVGNQLYACTRTLLLVRVSSVLNKDTKTYGKKFLFDGADDTCWNSDEGNTQWIILNFECNVSVSQVIATFE